MRRNPRPEGLRLSATIRAWSPSFSSSPSSNGNWRWATKPGDVQTRGFHTVWADNRHLVPPQNPDPGTPWIEWNHYPDYDDPGSERIAL